MIFKVDIAKLIPIASNKSIKDSMKKLKYLNTNNIPKLSTMAAMLAIFLFPSTQSNIYIPDK